MKVVILCKTREKYENKNSNNQIYQEVPLEFDRNQRTILFHLNKFTLSLLVVSSQFDSHAKRRTEISRKIEIKLVMAIKF